MQYSKCIQNSKKSEIRELLKLTEKEGIISFAGGLPAPESFPAKEISKILEDILYRMPEVALQYACTEGYTPLRANIAKKINVDYDVNISPKNIMITSGSQQGLDLTAKLFINENDCIAVESPTYLAALNVFRGYLANFIEIPTDNEGMIPEELEKRLKENNTIKFIYVIPDFQNPTGRTWSFGRRQALLQLAKKYKIQVVEDCPYRDIRFEGEQLPSIYSMDQDKNVISLGTFSKVFCPGLRVAWIVAKKDIIEKYVLLKQSVDLHSPTLNQVCVSEYMERFGLDDNIKRIVSIYKPRRDAMVDAINRYFPKNCNFVIPEGGLFLWVFLNEKVDTTELLKSCIERNVAFVPGKSFFANNIAKNAMRLNFSNQSEENIEKGIRIIAQEISVLMIKKKNN